MLRILPLRAPSRIYVGGANVRWNSKPAIAPVAMLQGRLKKANRRDPLLNIYHREKLNFKSIHWTLMVKTLFDKRKHTIMDSNPQMYYQFLQDLADVFEKRGIGMFGINQTASIVRHLTTDETMYSSAGARVVASAAQSFDVFVRDGKPADVAVILTAMARLDLRQPFHAAIDHLQKSDDRVSWVMTTETMGQIIGSCAKMKCKAPKLIHYFETCPAQIIGAHSSVKAIATIVTDYVSLGYRDKEVFKALVQQHHWIVKKGYPAGIADIVCAIASAEQTDCTEFFDAVESRVGWFVKHGHVTDLARIANAASMSLEATQLPRLFESIDAQAVAIFEACVPLNDASNFSPELPGARIEDLATIIASFATLGHKCPCLYGVIELFANHMDGETAAMETIESSLSLLGYKLAQSPKEETLE